MTWTLKMNEATARRCNKLTENGIQIDTVTHAGRKAIGYCYFDYIDDETQYLSYEEEE